MDSFLSGLFLAATAVVYIFVAARASKGVTTKDDYLLGSRAFSATSITMTLIATQLGAGMLFGTAAESYHKGFMGIAYILGMALGLIVLGLGVGAKLRSLNISTTAELFEKKYNSKTLRKFASIVSILTMAGILAAQIVASRQLFATMFDLSPIWLMGFWLTIIAYTMFGGIKAIIATDILQVIIIVVVFSAVLFLVIPLSEFSTILSTSTASKSQPLFAQGFFTTLIAPALYSIIEQDLAQRFFAAKSRRVATISALMAAAFLLTYALVPMSLGIYAKMIGIPFIEGQSPLVTLLQSKFSNFGMTIVACALLAAICSTADSLLGAASTNIIADFAREKEKYSLTISRVITFLVGVLALVVAFNFDSIINVIIKSYEISISALFVPLVFAMYMRKPPKLGAYLSLSFGLTTFLFAQFFTLDVSATLVSLVASLIGFLLGVIACANKNATTK